MKKSIWFLSGVLAALTVSLCFFGIRLRIAPRIVLSRALGTAVQQLDSRFERSPVHLLAHALDSRGRQQSALKLETEGLRGAVVYDMNIRSQLTPNRICAEGAIISGGKILDLTLYLDEHFAAVSSRGLVDGQYFGITYDTFPEDLRDRQLLAALIGEKTITKWETSVAGLEETMTQPVCIPALSVDDLMKVLYGSMALEPEIRRGTIQLPDTGVRSGYVVTFRIAGTELAAIAAPYRERLMPELFSWIDSMGEDPESMVTINFYLDRGRLLQISAQLENGDKAVKGVFHIGELPGTEPISLRLELADAGEKQQYELKITTESKEETYREQLQFQKTEGGHPMDAILHYQWDLSSGDMTLKLCVGSRKAEQRLNLRGEGETLTIRSQNIRPLLNFLLEQGKNTPAICTLMIAPGKEVPTPEYRNMDQWSAEDLLTLLAGFGELLGVDFP